MPQPKRTRRLPWLWLLLLCLGGCSSATAVLPSPPIEAYRFREMRGGVGVGLEPYFTTEQSAQAFRGGESFPENGVLPVRVFVQNGTGGEITVDSRDFRLVRPGSRGEAPLSARDAFSFVKVSPRAWAAVPIIGGSVTAARNEPRLKDLESRELRQVTIPAGSSTTGFVYFGLPEGVKNLAGSRVVLAVKAAPGREITFDIPLQGRRDIPAPSGASGSAGAPAPPAPTPSVSTTPSGATRIEGLGGGVIIRSPSP